MNVQRAAAIIPRAIDDMAKSSLAKSGELLPKELSSTGDTFVRPNVPGLDELCDCLDDKTVPATVSHVIVGMSREFHSDAASLLPNEINGSRVLEMCKNGISAAKIWKDVMDGTLLTRDDGFDVLIKMCNNENAQAAARYRASGWLA